jgi:hypothetical protein
MSSPSPSSPDPRDPTGAAPADDAAERIWLARCAEQLRQAADAFDVQANWLRVAAGVRAQPPRTASRWQRLLHALPRSAWAAASGFALGAASAAAVVLGVHGALPLGAQVQPLAERGEVVAAQSRLQVVWNDDARVAQIAATLSALDAQVVGGPGRIGVWTVSVPAARASAALDALAHDPAVQSVRRLDGGSR